MTPRACLQTPLPSRPLSSLQASASQATQRPSWIEAPLSAQEHRDTRAGLSSQHSLPTATLPRQKAALRHQGRAEPGRNMYSHPHVNSDSRLNTWLWLMLIFIPNSNAVILQYYCPMSLCLIFRNTTIYQSHTQMNQILITSVIDTQK